eukprot:SAG31_NODE_1640_length_7666_cov_11.488437_7_plen_33_part_00
MLVPVEIKKHTENAAALLAATNLLLLLRLMLS